MKFFWKVAVGSNLAADWAGTAEKARPYWLKIFGEHGIISLNLRHSFSVVGTMSCPDFVPPQRLLMHACSSLLCFGILTIGLPFNAVNAFAQATDEVSGAMEPYAQEIRGTEEVIEMIPIVGGKFVMGSPNSEADRGADEGPQHEVEVAPFWMGKYEITWDQYDVWGENIDIARRQIFGTKATDNDNVADAVTRPTPPYTDMSFGMGKRKNPAICMTQHAARKYCAWLSAKTGHYYRLPTEAEWEYACRAGTTTAFSFGNDTAQLDDYAWHAGNSDDSYHEVGQKKPNPWGLHDIHGNVAEWVLDQYLPDAYSSRAGGIKNPLAVPTKLFPRVVRGGGWDDEPKMLRSAVREGSSEEWKEQDPQIPQSIWYHTDALGVGFRVVRPLNQPSPRERTAKWDNTAPAQLDPVVE